MKGYGRLLLRPQQAFQVLYGKVLTKQCVTHVSSQDISKRYTLRGSNF